MGYIFKKRTYKEDMLSIRIPKGLKDIILRISKWEGKSQKAVAVALIQEGLSSFAKKNQLEEKKNGFR